MKGLYIFHMGDKTTRQTEAESLNEALIKLGLTLDKPIGTDDGNPNTVVLIEFDSKGQKWTFTDESKR